MADVSASDSLDAVADTGAPASQPGDFLTSFSAELTAPATATYGDEIVVAWAVSPLDGMIAVTFTVTQNNVAVLSRQWTFSARLTPHQIRVHMEGGNWDGSQAAAATVGLAIEGGQVLSTQDIAVSAT